MNKLQRSVAAFTALEELITDGGHQLFHKVVSAMHDLCFSILEAEKQGMSRQEIEKIIKPARDIHSRSVFVNRLQEWPREYPGDYETVEYICDMDNKSLYGTVEYFIEEYALNSAIAQQHRNKLHHQSEILLGTLLNGGDKLKIFSAGCGGCRDIMSIATYIGKVDFDLVINDIDNDALKLSKERLATLRHLHVVTGNIIQAVRKVEKLGPFDLIVTGGMFDHMSDKHVAFFLKHTANTLLHGGGRLFLANSIEENPFRVWMEYLADWKLHYRSEENIRGLMKEAGFSENTIHIKKDETGLTYFVEAEIEK